MKKKTETSNSGKSKIRKKSTSDESTSADQQLFLTFTSSGEHYGFEIEAVTEIVRLSIITPLPEVYRYIKGVINLRGKILPVVDFRTRLGMDIIKYNDRTCIIVIQNGNVSVGVIVDTVSEVITIEHDRIEKKPSINSNMATRFVKGIARVNELVHTLIDTKKFLYDLNEQEIVGRGKHMLDDYEELIQFKTDEDDEDDEEAEAALNDVLAKKRKRREEIVLIEKNSTLDEADANNE